MKKLLIIVCAFAFLSGCKQEDIMTSGAHFGEEIKLMSGNSLQVSSKNSQTPTSGPLKVIIEGISDSRCPKDVTCVWAGKADVALILTSADNKSANVSLCLGQCDNSAFKEKDTKTVVLGGVTYKVTLLQVNPYPDSKNKTTNQHVILQIEQV